MDEELKPGLGLTRLAAVKSALRLFAQAKAAAAPRHRFALVALRETADWRAAFYGLPPFSVFAVRFVFPRCICALHVLAALRVFAA